MRRARPSAPLRVASQTPDSGRRLRCELDRQRAKVQNCTRYAQEVHSEDAAELKSVVQLTHLDLEAFQAAAIYREPIDLAHEDMLVAAHASKPT